MSGPSIDIQMTGLDHTTAPVDVRERFSFTTTAQGRVMETLAARPEIRGVVLLSTCNRTELWVHSREEVSTVLRAALCEEAGVADMPSRFVSRRGEEAASYLFSTASGLKSQIFGEDQILTQVKEALDRARTLQCAGSVLEVLFRMAVTAAKRAKSCMQTSLTNANAVGCAIRRLQAEGFGFQDKSCLVIGNGRMGKLAAQSLREAGARVTVTTRQYRSGVLLIPSGCARIDYGRRMELIPRSDIVVSATSSPNLTIRYEDLSACGWKPGAVFLDLAVPRDIDPRAASLPNLRLFDIDSFEVPPSDDLEAVQREAEAVLDAQLREFITWYDCRDLLPAVERLSGLFARDTAARLDGALRPLGPDESARLRAQIEDAAKKQLRRFLFTIRDEAGAAAFRACLSAAETQYGEVTV